MSHEDTPGEDGGERDGDTEEVPVESSPLYRRTMLELLRGGGWTLTHDYPEALRARLASGVDAAGRP